MFSCCCHVILLKSRSLQKFTKSHFVSILNCLNVFDITILYIISELRVRKRRLAETENWPLYFSVKSSGESALELFSTILIQIVLMRVKSYHLEGGLIDLDRVYSERINSKNRIEKFYTLGHSRPTIFLQYLCYFIVQALIQTFFQLRNEEVESFYENLRNILGLQALPIFCT